MLGLYSTAIARINDCRRLKDGAYPQVGIESSNKTDGNYFLRLMKFDHCLRRPAGGFRSNAAAN